MSTTTVLNSRDWLCACVFGFAMALLVGACGNSGASGAIDSDAIGGRSSAGSSGAVIIAGATTGGAAPTGGANGGGGQGGAGGALTAAGAGEGGGSGAGGSAASASGGRSGNAGSGNAGSGNAGSGNAGSGNAGAGPLVPSFQSMWSGTVVATPSQQLMSASGNNTYRTYVRPRASGRFKWAFWVSNGVDSTYGGGQAKPNQIGGSWRIEAAYVADAGSTHTGGVVTGSSIPLTFGGSASKSVGPGDRFWSDPVEIDLPAGHDLAFTWTLSGTGYPFVSASFITTYKGAGKSIAQQESASGFAASNDPLVAPQVFAYDRPISKRLCFLGDSITQGVGSGANTYGYWVAKIGAGLSPDIGIWNLGSGWARAADASSDGYWLYKAKQCTEVAIVLGVNDLQSSNRTSAQVLGDLTTIIKKLKENKPEVNVILFTVPTFSLTGSQLNNWRAVNSSIRATPPSGTNRVFDIAAVLSDPSNDGQVQSQYHGYDAHPNDAGSAAIAKAFLSWYGGNP